jgi:hypothetical protein
MLRAIDLDAECLRFVGIGRWYQNFGRNEEAVHPFVLAVEREPKNGEVLWMLANAHFASGDTANTLAVSDRLFALGDPRGFVGRAEVRAARNDREGALADWHAYLELRWCDERMNAQAREKVAKLAEKAR